MAAICCRAGDARHCRRRSPGEHRTPQWQLPDVFVPHYEENCTCFSCRWVRETQDCFLLSKKGYEDPPFPVTNPTHDRVPENQRRRLLRRVPKKKFQIMYIYAMEIRPKTWGWVAVPPQPLLPFLLTEEKYSRISRFARHPDLGWFGIDENGQQVRMDQEMQPPLYNPLYEYFGYDPRCSPYRLYRPCPENASGELAGSPSGDHDNSSTRDTTISPCSAGKTDPSSEDQAGSSPQEKHAPTPEEQAILSPEDQAATRSTDQTNAATGNITSPSAEVQANTSVDAAATSSPGEIPPDLSILNNDEWLVVDPRCANPPAVAGPSNDRCHDSHHNGRYHGLRGGNRHTDWCNTTLFVGGLDANMTGEKLHYWFEGFGELMHVRKKVGQTCGFVQYGGRKEAEMAMLQMQGFPVFGARLRLSWGKPERHLDERCWGVHRQSALRAFEGYQEFRARMARGEPRRGSDPDFWTN